MVEPREKQICDRLLAGDASALAELYDLYAGVVYGLALRVTGQRGAAEDVTQEVFVSMWERPDRFRPELGSLRSWLGVLAHRRSVDRVRREASARRRDERNARRTPAVVTDVEERALDSVSAGRVRSALDDLPDDQRQVIDLAYFQGQTYREVAQSLGIPEGTAKSRIRMGLQRLAGSLQSEVVEEGTP